MRFKMVNEICINYENSADRFINVKEENQHFYQLSVYRKEHYQLLNTCITMINNRG